MKKNIGKIIIIISVMWILHTFTKNFIIDPNFETFLSRKDITITDKPLWMLMIRLHILFALVSLLTGPLGVIKRIRVKSIKFHRWNGLIYVLSVILNFIPGVYTAFFATGGWLNTIGFLILNTIWLATTILGYWYIKKQNVKLHREWFIRSFFLTFANNMIYVILTITYFIMHIPYEISYTISVWLCWIINLLIAEIVIRKKLFL